MTKEKLQLIKSYALDSMKKDDGGDYTIEVQPSTILELIDHTDKLREENARLRTALEKTKECLEMNEDKDEVAIEIIGEALK